MDKNLIIIPTFNNLDYLNLCVKSLEKNSHFKNEILLHINEGSDGTLNFAKKKGLIYTHSKINDGFIFALKPFFSFRF